MVGSKKRAKGTIFRRVPGAGYAAEQSAAARGRRRLCVIQLLLELFHVPFIHALAHLAQGTAGFPRLERAAIEVDANDAHAVNRSRLWRGGKGPRRAGALSFECVLAPHCPDVSSSKAAETEGPLSVFRNSIRSACSVSVSATGVSSASLVVPVVTAPPPAT
jgi:hypothetical protein